MVWARRAISACRPSGLSWRRNSVVRSVSRARLADIESSLRTAFSLRLRCLSTPAASSMNARRSSGRDSRISESLPWPTMTCISRPMPESLSSSWTSIKRQLLPLISYSLAPSRNIRRVIDTSEYSIGSALSELSIVTVTSARPSGARDDVPAKMTSSILPPRSVLAPCSPITQVSASTTLDLPEPLGPTTQVMPGSKRRVVGEAKDLKPFSVRLLRCMTRYPTAAEAHRSVKPESASTASDQSATTLSTCPGVSAAFEQVEQLFAGFRAAPARPPGRGRRACSRRSPSAPVPAPATASTSGNPPPGRSRAPRR